MGTEIITEPTGHSVGDLVHRITDDVKTIAKNEIELAKDELSHSAKTAATETAVIVLGGVVALIGFAMLCASAVAALSRVIPLWASLLIMAAIYLVVGGVVAGVFAKRLSRDVKPDLAVPSFEAKRTVTGIKESLQHS